MRFVSLLLFALSLVSCSDNEDTAGTAAGASGAAGQGGSAGAPAGGSGGQGGGASGSGGSAGASSGAAGSGGADPPPPPSLDPCERLLPGPPGAGTFAVELSAAHASVRFFGVETSHEKVDLALVAALALPSPFGPEGLAEYAKQLGLACALPASEQPLPAAKVELLEKLAVVHPGAGALALPEGAEAVAIDLRDLPAVEGLREALERAVAAASGAAVARPKLRVRQHNGMTDEAYGPLVGVPNGVYSNEVISVTQEPIKAGAAADLPLALLTGPKLAPEAAQLAVALRRARRAWLVGEDVLTAVGEMRWYGVGSGGLAHRDRVLGSPKPLPDVIAADLRTAFPEQKAAAVVAQGQPPPIDESPGKRAALEPFPTKLAVEAGEATAGRARAALTVVHGAARLFFPYFSVVGDTIDQGLTDELAAVDSEPDLAFRRRLGRLSTHLHDSHGFILAMAPPATPAKGGYVPLLLDDSDAGEAIVRRSMLPGVSPGDVVLSVGGKPTAEILAFFAPFFAASTPGAARRDQLSASLYAQGATSLQLRDPSGQTRTVDVAADALSSTTLAPSVRAHGALADLGAPDLFYINLDGPIFKDPLTAAEILQQAKGAKGLILDGRGYPGTLETWHVIEAILQQPTVIKLNVTKVSPLARQAVANDQPWNPSSDPRFEGPVAVLIGPWTQSQAEHILIPLVNTKRVTFVGRQSAGADGNITGVTVPGQTGVTFTGMEVLFADGSTFHGHGILPTVEVKPSQALFTASDDPELARAVELLK